MIVKFIFRGRLYAFLFFVVLLSCAQVGYGDELLVPPKGSDVWRIWAALLHVDAAGEPKIKDSDFVLSWPQFSLENEWVATVKRIKDDPGAVCLFPARFKILTKAGVVFDADLNDCRQYQIYIDRVPVDKINLIYASENVSSPSSTMGHVMLSLEGPRSDKKWYRHSVSFFVELKGYNPLSILRDTIYPGSKGYFILSPLVAVQEHYNKNEQRSVWAFELDLDESQRSLVADHVWELKFADIGYSFHAHNCATLILDVLKVAYTDLSISGYVTPVDLVKATHAIGMVRNAGISPSPEWQVRLISDAIDDQDKISRVKDWLESSTAVVDDLAEFDVYQTQLALAALQYQYETGQIVYEQYASKKSIFSRYGADEVVHFELYDYKTPVKTPGDSSVTWSYVSGRGSRFIGFNWLLAGHQLSDDNRNYFSESEIKMSDVRLLFDYKEQRIELDSWDIYSAYLLNPVNSLVAGNSGRFSIAYGDQYDSDLVPSKAVYLNLAMGKTYPFGRDVRVFGMLDGMYRFGKRPAGLSISPEVGFYLYEIFNMKTVASLSKVMHGDNEGVWQFNVSHSLFLDESSLVVEYSKLGVNGKEADYFSVGYRQYF